MCLLSLEQGSNRGACSPHGLRLPLQSSWLDRGTAGPLLSKDTRLMKEALVPPPLPPYYSRGRVQFCT